MYGSYKTMVTTALSLSLSLWAAGALGAEIAIGSNPNPTGQDVQKPIKYSGAQLNDVLSNWNESAPETGLASRPNGPATAPQVKPVSAPAGQPPQSMVNEVGEPAADWQILAGLGITAALVIRIPRRFAVKAR